MFLLKKDVPFHWDDAPQRSFEALKCSFVYAPLIIPPDYGKDFLLYLTTIESTIGMVLVQENDMLEEHIIYYLSRGLVGTKLNYTHVKKLTLLVVHVVQLFRHYILLRKATIITVVNPFQYVLT